MTLINRTHSSSGRSNCFTCELRSSMVCAEVSLDDLLAFHVPIEDLTFEPSATVYNIAEEATGVYCMRQGVIKLLRYDISGNQRIVRFLKKGDVLGLESMFADAQQHTAIALTEVRLCRIPMTHFKAFIAKYPNLQFSLLEKSQSALRDADIWLSEFSNNTVPAKSRLARLLLQLQIGFSDRLYRLNLADFGSILGIAPETISRLLNELCDAGILVKAGSGRSGRNFRADMPALSAIAQHNGRARQTPKTY